MNKLISSIKNVSPLSNFPAQKASEVQSVFAGLRRTNLVCRRQKDGVVLLTVMLQSMMYMLFG